MKGVNFNEKVNLFNSVSFNFKDWFLVAAYYLMSGRFRLTSKAALPT